MNLHDIFNYDPMTGHLTFKVRRGRLMPGSRAGTFDASTGYRQVRVDGRIVYEHRVIWALLHGEYPETHVDHINRDKTDNRAANLRLTTFNQSDNNQNTKVRSDSTTGVKGVNWNKTKSKWQARLSHRNRTYSLGYFNSFDEACAARYAAEAEHHTFGASA